MKKSIKVVFLAMVLTLSLGTITACFGGNNDDGGGNTNTEQGGNNDNGGNNGGGLSQVELPSKASVIQARQNVLESNVEGYDFTMNFGGTIAALGISATANAHYEGQYRHNKATNDVQFKRTTSGALLYDSTAYVYTKGAQKVQVKMNDKNEVKKISVVPNNDEDITLINKPIVAIVDALEVENLGEIQTCSVAGFDYEVGMNFSSDNRTLDRLCTALEGLGTSVSMKDVTVSNPFGGIKLLFNLDSDNKLEDFKISAEISFPVKSATATFSFTYEQHGATDSLTMPATSGLIMDSTAIGTEITAINASLADLKNDEDYSLDLLAENEFDPAWNKFATVDRYTGRLYKNTDDEDASKVWFNHSYKYNSHTEEDGAENFEYAIGNIESGEVYIASYKGSNTYTLIEDKTVDTQFDYMLAPALQTASNIDCIKKVTDGNKTTYYMYLNEAGTASVQDCILDMINSNTAVGVTKVENYFNSDYIVKEAEVVVEVIDGKVSNVKCLTELKYCPTGGEYTEYNITLTNTIELKANDKLSAAQKYKAPGKADGFIDNLESIL